MIHRRRAFRACLAGVLIAVVLTAFTALATPTTHVVILVMDGARYSETWGDPTHANIPQIATNLARQGIVLTSLCPTNGTAFYRLSRTDSVGGLLNRGGTRIHPARLSRNHG